MNVKNIDDFLHDIDQEKIKDWRIEPDCHPKVKKIVLEIETVLMEEEYEKTIQMTLEKNLRRDTYHSYINHSSKQWEFDKSARHVITEKLVKEIVSDKQTMKELDAPIKGTHDYALLYKDNGRYGSPVLVADSHDEEEIDELMAEAQENGVKDLLGDESSQ